MVAAELAQQSSLEAAAQSVVERVKRLHHDAYVSGRQRASHCARHEDMTLLIRIINYPLADGSLTPTQGQTPLISQGTKQLNSSCLAPFFHPFKTQCDDCTDKKKNSVIIYSSKSVCL